MAKKTSTTKKTSASKKQKVKRFSLVTFDNEHYKRTEAYTKAVETLFNNATTEIAKAAAKGEYDPDKPFSFNDYPSVKAVMQSTTEQLASRVKAVIETGAKNEWLYACEKNDEFLESILETSKLSKEQLSQWQDQNLDALKTFQERKVNGLGLSQRVWNYVDQYKEQLESALDVGLGEGRSAAQLSRDIRENLKEPDRLFRRVRDKRGNLVLSKAAKAYHPGRGIYRSSTKNAQRLARSEINMAYRQSDHLRWQALDFVVGFTVKRSNHKPQFECDTCEKLKGDYPKTFKFVGWHPQCRCYAIPILQDEETLNKNRRERLKVALKGGTYKKYEAKNAITDVPENFKKWMLDHADYYASASAAGTLPYFLRDNEEIVKDVLLHSLNDVSLKFNDPNNIANQEIVDALKAFAVANPHMFNGGLQDVEIKKSRSYFFANQRRYDSNLVYDGKGNKLLISEISFDLDNGEVYNPLEEVKGAMRAISLGQKTTFKQEYALEGLWHEIKHAQSAGWRSRKNYTDLNGAAMETVNQFCARHSYADFVKSLGGEAVNVSSVISRGYGYRYSVANFQSLLYTLDVNQTTAHRYFRSIIQQKPYEDIFDEIVKFVKEKGGLEHSEAYDTVEKMLGKSRADFNEYLKNLKKK